MSQIILPGVHEVNSKYLLVNFFLFTGIVYVSMNNSTACRLWCFHSIEIIAQLLDKLRVVPEISREKEENISLDTRRRQLGSTQKIVKDKKYVNVNMILLFLLLIYRNL